MKVRARVKAPEFLPEWAKCCEDFTKHVLALPAISFAETKEISEVETGYCNFCGSKSRTANIMTRLVDGREGFMGIDLLDLDEGPIENSEQPLKTSSQV